MKLSTPLRALVLAAATFLLTSAAQAVSSNAGDLFLGFRASGGTGATVDYMVNIGPASQFEGNSIVTLNLGSVGTDLTSIFGGSWNSRSDVFWGIAGTVGLADLGNDPAKTTYATREEPSLGTESLPWVRHLNGTQSPINGKLIAMQNAFNVSSATGISATNAVQQSTADTNSWASYQPGGTTANSGQTGTSFAAFDPTIEGSFVNGTSNEALDLFRMQLGTEGTPGDYLGRFIISNSGQLTFIPVAAFGSGTVTIENAAYSVNSDAGTLQVNVTRTGDTTSPASVNISTVQDGTAVAGTDFTALDNQVVTFGVGVTTVAVPVTILAASNGGTFSLSLSSLSSGLTAGAHATVAVTISHPVVASVVDFASATFNADQSATSVTVNLVRSVGTSAVSVNIATPGSIDDTAVAGTDYVVPTGLSATVTFVANSNSGSATITLKPQAGPQPNKQFAVSISASQGSHASVGTTQPTTMVRILADDTAPPTVTLTNPAANASIPGPNVTIAGSSTDNKGVDEVQVTLNGVAYDADLSPTGSGAGWSITLPAAGGLNTIKVQAFDGKRNASPIVSRSFTYSKKSGLTISIVTTNVAGSTGNAVTGTLAATGTPYSVGSTYTFTATAKPGYVFDHWTIPGLSGSITEVPKLVFVFSDLLASSTPPTITATFIVNPFKAANTGAYNGLVTARAGSTASNSTTGFINVTVTPTGAFSGTLKIDGLSLPISGVFDNTGVARFGTARTTTILVPRVVRPALELALNNDVSGTTAKITGTVKQYMRNTVIDTSDVVLDRAAFSKTIPVTPSTYVANKGLYTIVFPAKAQPVGIDLTTADYPQGDGIGTLTVTSAGNVTLSGTLADGTAITASAPLSKTFTVPLYAQLYINKNGSFSGLATLDLTQPDSDVSGTNFNWFRPWSSVQYYPWGWDEGVKIDLVGAQFAAPTGSSILKKPGTLATALSATTSANASLALSDGDLTNTFSKNVTVFPTDAVSTGTPADATFTLVIPAPSAANTGKFSGDFIHTNGSRPKYQGIILQKGANAGGYGFFLTVAPKVTDGTGLSGGVSLTGH